MTERYVASTETMKDAASVRECTHSITLLPSRKFPSGIGPRMPSWTLRSAAEQTVMKADNRDMSVSAVTKRRISSHSEWSISLKDSISHYSDTTTIRANTHGATWSITSRPGPCRSNRLKRSTAVRSYPMVGTVQLPVIVRNRKNCTNSFCTVAEIIG